MADNEQESRNDLRERRELRDAGQLAVELSADLAVPERRRLRVVTDHMEITVEPREGDPECVIFSLRDVETGHTTRGKMTLIALDQLSYGLRQLWKRLERDLERR